VRSRTNKTAHTETLTKEREEKIKKERNIVVYGRRVFCLGENVSRSRAEMKLQLYYGYIIAK
jgi:hypothetical protein